MTLGLRSRSAGMTLLELLVAIAIMAMALGMLYRAVGGSAHTAAAVAQRQQALLIAQSLLWANADLPAQGWQEDGQSNGYQWSVRTAPYATAVQRSVPAATPLQELRVTVSWLDEGQAHSLQLATLVAQRPPPATAAGITK
ncbi:MAG: prepilin-type N-terminal cleavage/methylation domain-containing protein [Comamonas sp.]